MVRFWTPPEGDGFSIETDFAPMPPSRRILAWIEIAAGVGAGTVAIIPFVVPSEAAEQLNPSLLQVTPILFAAALSLGAGWQLLRGGRGSWTLSALLFALQIPVVDTPAVSFSFFAGPRAVLTFWPRVSGEFGFGFGLSAGQGNGSIELGINLVALALVVQLSRSRSPGLTPVAGDVGLG
jgi:hypothetical protein